MTTAIPYQLTDTGWEAARAAANDADAIPYTLTDLGWTAAREPEDS